VGVIALIAAGFAILNYTKYRFPVDLVCCVGC